MEQLVLGADLGRDGIGIVHLDRFRGEGMALMYLFYVLFGPFFALFLFNRAGGKTRRWHWGVILMYFAILIKGVLSLILSCG